MTNKPEDKNAGNKDNTKREFRLLEWTLNEMKNEKGALAYLKLRHLAKTGSEGLYYKLKFEERPKTEEAVQPAQATAEETKPAPDMPPPPTFPPGQPGEYISGEPPEDDFLELEKILDSSPLRSAMRKAGLAVAICASVMAGVAAFENYRLSREEPLAQLASERNTFRAYSQLQDSSKEAMKGKYEHELAVKNRMHAETLVLLDQKVSESSALSDAVTTYSDELHRAEEQKKAYAEELADSNKLVGEYWSVKNVLDQKLSRCVFEKSTITDQLKARESKNKDLTKTLFACASENKDLKVSDGMSSPMEWYSKSLEQDINHPDKLLGLVEDYLGATGLVYFPIQKDGEYCEEAVAYLHDLMGGTFRTKRQFVQQMTSHLCSTKLSPLKTGGYEIPLFGLVVTTSKK